MNLIDEFSSAGAPPKLLLTTDTVMFEKPSIELALANVVALLLASPFVTTYDMFTTLPLLNALPITPSPNVISYC